jgi:hypothetical protein
MSNIALVVKLVESNPTLDKAALVEMVIAQLKVTKSNAQVYVYNAQKKLGKPTRKVEIPADLKAANKRTTASRKAASITRAEIVAKSDEEIARIKDERLAQMKSIGERRCSDEQLEIEAKKDEMLAEVDDYLEESKAYVDSLTAPTRKFLLGAE